MFPEKKSFNNNSPMQKGREKLKFVPDDICGYARDVLNIITYKITKGSQPGKGSEGMRLILSIFHGYSTIKELDHQKCRCVLNLKEKKPQVIIKNHIVYL